MGQLGPVQAVGAQPPVNGVDGAQPNAAAFDQHLPANAGADQTTGQQKVNNMAQKAEASMLGSMIQQMIMQTQNDSQDDGTS